MPSPEHAQRLDRPTWKKLLPNWKSPPWLDRIAGAIALGALAGLLELGALEAQHLIKGPGALGPLQLNPEYPALVPLANLLIFGVIGAIFAIGASWSRRLERWGLRLLLVLAIMAPLLAFRKVHPLAWLLLAVGASWRLSGLIERHGDRARGLARRALPVLLLAVAVIVGVTFGSEPWAEARALAAAPVPPDGSPNVLLIVLDTVRADAMSVYGAERETTPRLEELAKQGVVFEQARSASSWTLPSHATMFTGRLPGEHRAGFTRPLDETYPTLAEHFSGRGYATGGFVANTIFASRYFGLGRGFHRYEDHVLTLQGLLRTSSLGMRVAEWVGTGRHMRSSAWTFRKDARRVNGEFLGWIDGQARDDRPFFAFLNYYDAHDPYVPPSGDAAHFGLVPETDDERALLQEWHERVKRPDELTPRMVRLARDCYDDCLRDLDARLGELFDALDDRGELDDTVVIVTSDHGEAFGEKPGIFSHGYWLHESMLRVPLLIARPGQIPAGMRVAEPSSLRDLAATIVDLAGLSGDAPFPGRSLASRWSGGSSGGAASPVFSEEEIQSGPKEDRKPATRRCLVAEGLTYHREPDGREELYDLRGDPRELHDLANSEAHREALARLRSQMDRAIAPPVTAVAD